MPHPRAPLAAVLTLVAVAGLSPHPARACSAPAPGLRLEVPTEVVDLPLEGVLVLPGASAYASLAMAPTVVVTGPAGEVVPGDAEVIVLRTTFSAFGAATLFRDLLFVWRARAPLAPDTDYEVRLESEWSTDVFQAHTRTQAYDLSPEVHAPSVTAERGVVSQGLAFTCEESDFLGGSCPDCRLTDEVDAVRFDAQLHGGTLDPFTIRRLVVDAPSRVEHAARVWDGGDRATVTAWALDAQDTYCVSEHAEDLVTGETVVSEPTCVEAPPAPAPAPEPQPTPRASAGGCSVVTPSGAGGGSLLAGLALGLFAVRRRRRA